MLNELIITRFHQHVVKRNQVLVILNIQSLLQIVQFLLIPTRNNLHGINYKYLKLRNNVFLFFQPFLNVIQILILVKFPSMQFGMLFFLLPFFPPINRCAFGTSASSISLFVIIMDRIYISYARSLNAR